MTLSFNGRRGLVLVSAALAGPAGRVIVRLALDRGHEDRGLSTQPAFMRLRSGIRIGASFCDECDEA